MKNLIHILILICTVNGVAQSDRVNSSIIFQEYYSSEFSDTSYEGRDLNAAVLAAEVADTEKKSTASLYPNPIVNQATIELNRRHKEIVVIIADIKGNIVKVDNFFDVALIQFDVNLPKGVYTMSAFDENEAKILSNLFIKK